MPKITFLPTGETFDVVAGACILDAALENGVFLEHSCGGNCACSTCCIEVEAGMEGLSPIEDDEEDTLELRSDRRDNHRLSCQARILGPVVVRLPH